MRSMSDFDISLQVETLELANYSAQHNNLQKKGNVIKSTDNH